MNGRIVELEKYRGRLAANAPGGDLWYQFKVAPSCPPDKRLHVRPGIPVLSIRWTDFVEDDHLPYTVCDFENETETQMDLVFANANYYLPIVLCYSGSWLRNQSNPIFDSVIGIEAATSVLAEAQIDGFLNGIEAWYYYRLPLCGVVLKNNGAAGLPYMIEPVDMVNRGRSYIYRDARSSGGIFA